MSCKRIFRVMLIVALTGILWGGAVASEKVTVTTGVDFYNRYVWRGLDIANTPSIQPSLALGYAGIEFGTWGAYALSNNASESDEIDFWLSYSKELESGVSFTAVVTDYYYPNAGIGMFNFNNYDAVKDDTIPDPGAHIVELGLSISGPASFPVTLSGYINVHNEAGNNAYVQLDFPVMVGESEVGFFCGVAGGSKDNPDYYGTDDLNVINLGMSVGRDLTVSESLSLPLNVTLIINPNAEISHLLVGLSF